jgi:hypothetical protein
MRVHAASRGPLGSSRSRFFYERMRKRATKAGQMTQRGAKGKSPRSRRDAPRLRAAGPESVEQPVAGLGGEIQGRAGQSLPRRGVIATGADPRFERAVAMIEEGEFSDAEHGASHAKGKSTGASSKKRG